MVVSNDIYQGIKKLAADEASNVKNQVTRLGTVAPDYIGGQVRVYFDGESSDTANSGTLVSCSAGFTPASGERVLLVKSGATWMILTGVAGIVSGAGGINPAAFGARGDGQTDDTDAIQRAFDSASVYGSKVTFGPGDFMISRALNIYSNMIVSGSHMNKTRIIQETDGENGLQGTDIDGFMMRDIWIEGPAVPGSGITTGTGLFIDRDLRDNTYKLQLENVYLRHFGAYGLDVSNAITSVWNLVIAEECGTGFNIHGVSGGSAGTSVILNGCYANGCYFTGFLVDTMVYMTFNSCAADSCGIGYEVIGAANHTQGIAFNACGTESLEDKDTDHPGIGWKIDGGFGIGLYNCWNFKNIHTVYWVTGGARAITLIGCTENSPEPSAQYSFKIDTGSSATIIDPSFSTEPDISHNGTVLERGAIFSDQFFYGSVGVGTEPSATRGDLVVANMLSLPFGATIKLGSDVFIYKGGTNVFQTDNAFKTGIFTTVSRPSAVSIGVGGQIYDLNLQKPIWSNGTDWTDAMGTVV